MFFFESVATATKYLSEITTDMFCNKNNGVTKEQELLPFRSTPSSPTIFNGFVLLDLEFPVKCLCIIVC